MLTFMLSIYDGSSFNGDNVTWRCVIGGGRRKKELLQTDPPTLNAFGVEGGDGAFRNTNVRIY